MRRARPILVATCLFIAACGDSGGTEAPPPTGGPDVPDTTTVESDTAVEDNGAEPDTAVEDSGAEPDTTVEDTGVEPDATVEDTNTDKCTPESCDDKDKCTIDTCDPAVGCSYAPSDDAECCTPSVLTAGFESGDPAIFTFTNSDPDAGWQIVPKSATGDQPNESGALYYGNVATWTFAGAGTNSGDAVSAPVTLPEATAISLSFKVYLDVEQANYGDHLTVAIDSGSSSYVIWTKVLATKFMAWDDVTVDVSAFAGKQVSLHFSFDTFDAVQNDTLGIFVDDISLATTCQPHACAAATDCDDGLGVTLEACTDGACAFLLQQNKCTADADCKPSSACAVAVCFAGLCGDVAAPSCCSTNEECDDGDACTFDQCDTFAPVPSCSHFPDPQCCESDAACDDQNPCTTDSCTLETKSCAHAAVAGCCVTAADCSDGDKCTVETCGQSHTCSSKNVCCKADADCKDTDDKCTVEACTEGVCAAAYTGAEGCCAPVAYAEDFDDGKTDWAIKNNNAKVGWQVWEKPTVGKTAALYYGNPATKNFEAPAATSGTATTGPITLPKGSDLWLSFNGYFDIEGGDGYDVFEVRVEVDGKQTVLVPKSAIQPVGPTFKPIKASLAKWAGQTVAIVFAFDTIDTTLNATLGVLLDDVHVDGLCTSVACTKSEDCDDKDASTIDTCIAGHCGHADELACNGDADCEDGNACTMDTCLPSGECDFGFILPGCCQADADCKGFSPCDVGKCVPAVNGPSDQQCEFTKKPGCCLADVECLDGNKCTLDKCAADHTCSHPTSCCEKDADCADTDAVCTVEKCANGTCLHSGLTTEQCCVPAKLDESFDDGVADGWTFENDDLSGTYGWKVWDKPKVGTSPALYFGDTATGTGGNFSGAAVSPMVTLPLAGTSALHFGVYVDGGAQFSGAAVQVYLRSIDGPEQYVWGSDPAKDKTFVVANVDLTPWAGQTGAVVFRYQPAFGPMPGLGALVDGVAISSCTSAKCELDLACDDGLVETVDACVSGTCAYAPVIPDCEGNAECDDKNPCTADACVSAACVHGAIPNCCATDAACSDGESKCTTEHCVAGTCQTKPTGAEGCCTPFAYTENFDDGKADDWTLVNSSTKVGWNVWATPSVGTSAALYYGIPAAKNYELKDAGGQSIAHNGTATTPVIKLPPGATDAKLTFKLYLDTENQDASSANFDLFEVSVIVGGQSTVLMGKAGIPLAEWTTISLQVGTYAGKDIQVRLSEDTKDGLYNTTLGVLVDDFQVSTQCTPKKCTADKDCDDGAVTTVESCVAGTCATGVAPKACLGDFDCNDADACTSDLCLAGTCTAVPVKDCCTADAQCDDGNKCTKDVCTIDQPFPPPPPPAPPLPGGTGICHNDPIPACK